MGPPNMQVSMRAPVSIQSFSPEMELEWLLSKFPDLCAHLIGVYRLLHGISGSFLLVFTAVISLALHPRQARLKESLGISQGQGPSCLICLTAATVLLYRTERVEERVPTVPSISRFLLGCLPFQPYVWRLGHPHPCR